MIGKGTKVEIVFSGTHRLVYINGMRVPMVIQIETPRDKGEIAGQVHLKFVASEIIEREVIQEEFSRLRENKSFYSKMMLHTGEAIFPSGNNIG